MGDYTEAKCQVALIRLQAIGILTLEPERLKNRSTTTRKKHAGDERVRHSRRSSSLRFQFSGIEVSPFFHRVGVMAAILGDGVANKRRIRYPIVVDEGRKRVIGIMAAILAARKLAQQDSTRPSPASNS